MTVARGNRLAATLFAAASVAAAAVPARAQEPPLPTPPTQTPAPPLPTLPAAEPSVQAPAPLEGERPSKPRLIVGPQVGVYVPTSATTEDAFGGAWTNFGIGVGRVRSADPRGAFAFEFQFLRNTRGGSRALLLPLTATYRRGLIPPGRGGDVRPYVGLGTGLYVADLRSEKYNVTSGFRGAFGFTALVGMTTGDRGLLEARYLGVGRVKGFDLSGFNLVAGFRF